MLLIHWAPPAREISRSANRISLPLRAREEMRMGQRLYGLELACCSDVTKQEFIINLNTSFQQHSQVHHRHQS